MDIIILYHSYDYLRLHEMEYSEVSEFMIDAVGG